MILRKTTIDYYSFPILQMENKEQTLPGGIGRGSPRYWDRMMGIKPTDRKSPPENLIDLDIPEEFQLPVAPDLLASVEADTRARDGPPGHNAQRAQSPLGQVAHRAAMPCQDIRQMGDRMAQVETRTRVIVMKEPYQNWRELAVDMIKRLVPAKSPDTGRFVSGYIARVVEEKDSSESYLITIRHDVNQNPGARVSSRVAVMEYLLRNMKVSLERDSRSGAPLPFQSPREKAGCGIKLRVALKTLAHASGI